MDTVFAMVKLPSGEILEGEAEVCWEPNGMAFVTFVEKKTTVAVHISRIAYMPKYEEEEAPVS